MYQPSYKDIKDVIFWDDLKGCDIIECIITMTYHDRQMAYDTMQRLGKTGLDLLHKARRLVKQWPDSYRGEDLNFAVWDAIDEWTTELVFRDSRIEKRLDII